jgi:hypothetical protein
LYLDKTSCLSIPIPSLNRNVLLKGHPAEDALDAQEPILAVAVVVLAV